VFDLDNIIKVIASVILGFNIESTKNRINSFDSSNPQGGLLNKDGRI